MKIEVKGVRSLKKSCEAFRLLFKRNPVVHFTGNRPAFSTKTLAGYSTAVALKTEDGPCRVQIVKRSVLVELPPRLAADRGVFYVLDGGSGAVFTLS